MKAWVKTLLVSHIITQKAGEKKMVKVWAARITPLFDKTNYVFYYEKLPEWRKEKADRLKSENAKAQSGSVVSLDQAAATGEAGRRYTLQSVPLRGICAVRLQ